MRPAAITDLVVSDPVPSLTGLLRDRACLLAELNTYTVNSIEAERKALARELHDEMGATLALLSLELTEMESSIAGCAHVEGMAQSVVRLRELLGALYDCKHRVIEGLRPPLLDDLGFEDAVRSYASKWTRQSGIKVTVRSLGPLPRLNEVAGLAMFRAVQESLTNTARHARASQVEIEMRVASRRIAVDMLDDGVGFGDSSQAPAGYGLLGIRERLEALGGTIAIRSRHPNCGTRVAFTMPLRGRLADPARLPRVA